MLTIQFSGGEDHGQRHIRRWNALLLMLLLSVISLHAQHATRSKVDKGPVLETICSGTGRAWANGDEIRLKWLGKVLFRLSYEGYDSTAKIITYRIQMPKGSQILAENSPFNLLGESTSNVELRFIPIDGTKREDSSYRFFRSIKSEKTGIQIDLYFSNHSWPLYSLSATGDPQELVLTRVADEVLLGAYREWRPLVKPNRYPDLEDFYLEVFIKGRTGEGNLGKSYRFKVGLPSGDLAGPMLLVPTKPDSH